MSINSNFNITDNSNKRKFDLEDDFREPKRLRRNESSSSESESDSDSSFDEEPIGERLERLFQYMAAQGYHAIQYLSSAEDLGDHPALLFKAEKDNEACKLKVCDVREIRSDHENRGEWLIAREITDQKIIKVRDRFFWGFLGGRTPSVKKGESDFLVEIFPFIEGKDLGSLLNEKETGFDEAVTLDYGIKIAESVALLHEKRIAWRDLRAENILVSPDDSIFLIDFTTAKKLDAFQEAPVSPIETEGYTPLEVFSSLDVYPKDWYLKWDCYSLGVLLYQMHYKQKVPTTGVVRREEESPLETVIRELLHDNPQERMNISEAVEILKKYQSALQSFSSSSTGSAVLHSA